MTDTYDDLIQASDEETTEIERPEPQFFIDQQWYEQQGRSFRAMAQGRFCLACQARLGEKTEERVPTVDKKTNKVVYEVREIGYGEQPMAVIRSHCSKERNYITPETPVIEAVYRVYLANGNQPVPLERVREQLGDWISLRERPHNYSVELLERLIRNDRRYGLREYAQEPL
jgi:hypothetical protein